MDLNPETADQGVGGSGCQHVSPHYGAYREMQGDLLPGTGLVPGCRASR
jgi:hypothetical protein